MRYALVILAVMACGAAALSLFQSQLSPHDLNPAQELVELNVYGSPSPSPVAAEAAEKGKKVAEEAAEKEKIKVAEQGKKVAEQAAEKARGKAAEKFGQDIDQCLGSVENDMFMRSSSGQVTLCPSTEGFIFQYDICHCGYGVPCNPKTHVCTENGDCTDKNIASTDYADCELQSCQDAANKVMECHDFMTSKKIKVGETCLPSKPVDKTVSQKCIDNVRSSHACRHPLSTDFDERFCKLKEICGFDDLPNCATVQKNSEVQTFCNELENCRLEVDAAQDIAVQKLDAASSLMEVDAAQAIAVQNLAASSSEALSKGEANVGADGDKQLCLDDVKRVLGSKWHEKSDLMPSKNPADGALMKEVSALHTEMVNVEENLKKIAIPGKFTKTQRETLSMLKTRITSSRKIDQLFTESGIKLVCLADAQINILISSLILNHPQSRSAMNIEHFKQTATLFAQFLPPTKDSGKEFLLEYKDTLLTMDLIQNQKDKIANNRAKWSERIGKATKIIGAGTSFVTGGVSTVATAFIDFAMQTGVAARAENAKKRKMGREAFRELMSGLFTTALKSGGDELRATAWCRRSSLLAANRIYILITKFLKEGLKKVKNVKNEENKKLLRQRIVLQVLLFVTGYDDPYGENWAEAVKLTTAADPLEKPFIALADKVSDMCAFIAESSDTSGTSWMSSSADFLETQLTNSLHSAIAPQLNNLFT